MNKLALIISISFSILVEAQDFIKRQGNILTHNGNQIMLRGMSFGNLVWVDNYADSPHLHHSEIDFKRVSDLGINAIRFYLNYKTFENDNSPYQYKQSGWDWIDNNIQIQPQNPR
ncbi:MAG: hypothetical protein SNJ77_12150 [Cytophagales bacterium]